MSKPILNLIEPTLFDQTGHSYTYVQCLVKANLDFNFDLRVWLDKRGANLLDNLACQARAYFYRPIRQLQKIFLYKKLLQQSGTILVGTCELWDLKILAYFARKTTPKAKVVLHFHQFKQSAKKIASLKKIAAMNLDFEIITPTAKLAEIFSQHGFKNCTVIACPTYLPAPTSNHSQPKFSKVLYAGAARSDKGFPEVIQALKYNRALGYATTFEIQTSPPNSQRYDEATQQALRELQDITPANLILHNDTLNQTQYLNLFRNAICLLIYKQQDYQDKFSAVALDAFYAGSPIITAKNTWMGDVAERYTAGIALDEYTPTAIQEAIDYIAANYELFHANAKLAAELLSELHDPKRTLEFLATVRNI